MKVLFYGPLADQLGSELEIGLSGGCSVGELRGALSRRHPNAARDIARSRAFIGCIVVRDEHRASAGDKVEFLPPVSGG